MNRPVVNERFSDNGEHSHWELINEDGEILWTQSDESPVEAADGEQGQEEAWRRYIDDLQAGVDRILRDKGASNREIYDAINDVAESMQNYYHLLKKAPE